MTYSGNLDSNLPGQGEFARLGAGRIRNLTKAVKERLASIFQDPDVDPLSFKPSIIPFTALKQSLVEFTYGAFGTTLGVGDSITSSEANTATPGSPVIVTWKVSALTDLQRAGLHVGAYVDGTNIHWWVKNYGTGPISLNGDTLSMLILLQ